MCYYNPEYFVGAFHNEILSTYLEIDFFPLIVYHFVNHVTVSCTALLYCIALMKAFSLQFRTVIPYVQI